MARLSFRSRSPHFGRGNQACHRHPSVSIEEIVSQAVHLIGAIGYVFWFVQAVQTSNVPMAAVAVIMAVAFIAGSAALLYLGVVSDDGVSAAEVVLYRQVKTVPCAIAMHEPIFDRAGRLVDLELGGRTILAIISQDHW